MPKALVLQQSQHKTTVSRTKKRWPVYCIDTGSSVGVGMSSVFVCAGVQRAMKFRVPVDRKTEAQDDNQRLEELDDSLNNRITDTEVSAICQSSFMCD